jgi:hypothetical protein
MVIDTGLFIIQQMLTLNPVILFGLVFLVVIIAYKVFKFVFKALLVGIAFATFPFIANMFGMGIPVTVTNILWSSFFGIVLFIIYGAISMSYKLTSFVFKPFRKAFDKPKQRVLVKEYERKKKG